MTPNQNPPERLRAGTCGPGFAISAVWPLRGSGGGSLRLPPGNGLGSGEGVRPRCSSVCSEDTIEIAKLERGPDRQIGPHDVLHHARLVARRPPDRRRVVAAAQLHQPGLELRLSGRVELVSSKTAESIQKMAVYIGNTSHRTSSACSLKIKTR